MPDGTQGFARRELSRDGVRLSYLDNDADVPVAVLLHGLAGCGEEFIPTAEAIGGHSRFILPDLRGHGASTRHPGDLSREAFTADTAALIRHVSPGRPVILGGQSMGGHTAILAAASCFLGDDALARSWIAHLEPAPVGGLVPPFRADVMEAIMSGVSEPCWPQWQSVRAPATAVFAAKGMFNADEQAAFIAARPRTRHVVLGGGSHDAHLDDTAEWAAVLRSVLDAQKNCEARVAR